LKNSPIQNSQNKLAQNEFANDISSAEFLGNEEVAESETSRRDFFKVHGLLKQQQQLLLRVKHL